MKSETWTPDQIATLRELVATGTTDEIIGKVLGLSKNAVLGKASRLGIGGQRRPIADVPHSRAATVNLFPSAGHCVWPHGYPGEDHFHFCGEHCRNPSEPYCAEHMARAYVPLVKRSAAERAIDRAAAKYGVRAA